MAKLFRFFPVIAWMIVIFYFSSVSTQGIGTTTAQRFLILKTFHLIEYAILSFLFCFATSNKKQSVILSYTYAISDETHQLFVPGRTGTIRDTLIDLIGIVIGTYIYEAFVQLSKRFK